MSSSPSVSVVMKASNAMQSSQSDLICWVVLVQAMHVASQPDRSIGPGINSGEPRTRFLSPVKSIWIGALAADLLVAADMRMDSFKLC